MPGNQPVPLACFAHQRGDSPANIEHQRLDVFDLRLWVSVAVFVVIIDKGEWDKFDVWQGLALLKNTTNTMHIHLEPVFVAVKMVDAQGIEPQRLMTTGLQPAPAPYGSTHPNKNPLDLCLHRSV